MVSHVRSLGFKPADTSKKKSLRCFSAVIVPACQSMLHRSNCRIFQNKSVTDIAKLLFGEHAVKYSTSRLAKQYPPYEYAVQYQESDWTFVSRLLAQEGIFYYFEQSASSHKLILGDDFSAYNQCEEDKVTATTAYAKESHIFNWESALSVTSGKYTERGYNLEKPATLPEGTHTQLNKNIAEAKHEVYEYNAENELTSRTKDISAIRLEEIQCQSVVRRGSSNCRSFQVGQFFTFDTHDDKTEKGKSYLLTGIEITASTPSQTGTASSEAETFTNGIACISKEVLFRPNSNVAKPVIMGVQTAVVTGSKQDKEIHIDDLGRVKVQFHWDREGKFDSKSSCWIRVSQGWAGDKFGPCSLFRPLCTNKEQTNNLMTE